MNSLLKDRKRFLEAAAAQPVVEHKSLPTKRAKLSATTANRSSASGSKNFALIHKVVNHMKELHLSGEPRRMTVGEILEECQSQSSVTNSTKQALEIALRENAKLKCDEIKGIYRFAFRPPIEGITNKKEFLKYICNYYNDGLGGLMKDAVIESIPKAEKVLEYHEKKGNIVTHTRPDKKVIIFYNDKSSELEIDEAFQKLWRSVPVAQLDMEKISDYLNKAGITSVDDPGIRKIMKPVGRNRRNNKKRKFKRLNTHIDEDNLHDYN